MILSDIVELTEHGGLEIHEVKATIIRASKGSDSHKTGSLHQTDLYFDLLYILFHHREFPVKI